MHVEQVRLFISRNRIVVMRPVGVLDPHERVALDVPALTIPVNRSSDTPTSDPRVIHLIVVTGTAVHDVGADIHEFGSVVAHRASASVPTTSQRTRASFSLVSDQVSSLKVNSVSET